MVRQTQAIPATKEHLATAEEKQQRDDYASNAGADYHAGINVGKEGFYDPEAGAAKHATEPVDEEPKPVLATDPGQPKGITANVVGRDNKAVDKTPQRVVNSGRKANTKATTKDS
jgi:hypothetical protein